VISIRWICPLYWRYWYVDGAYFDVDVDFDFDFDADFDVDLDVAFERRMGHRSCM